MPKRRILPFIILGIISNHPRITGKGITTEFQTEVGDFWKASHSQIYPELKRMTEDQWIIETTSPKNAKEKYYQISNDGQEVFNSWLSEPVTSLPVHQDLFSLKLFFINDPNDSRIPVLIEQQLSLLEKDQQYLKKRMQLLFSDQSMIKKQYGHYLILARAISRTKGQINWLEGLQSDIKNKAEN